MKILIIEDEAELRQTLQDLIELNGHTVLAAADGAAGVQLAASRPDLIFCDMLMPGMDGDEVIVAVRQPPQCRDIPFIFLTALAGRADQRLGMTLGADDYITKPFTERDIIEAIAARSRRQQSLRERIEQLVTAHRSEIDANWSHELMTPLNSILGGLELAEAEGGAIEPGELMKLLRLIRTGAERQLALSRKLVLYYELERLKAAASPARPAHCEAGEAMVAGAAQAAQTVQRTADLTVHAAAGLVPVAEAHLLAAVAEIVGNALRFSHPGQPVTVTGTREGPRYRIEITDQGPGMTAEQRVDVDAFKQFDRKKVEQQGLGLGLAIARSVAEIADGQLRLEPGPGGRGLHVTFDLRAV